MELSEVRTSQLPWALTGRETAGLCGLVVGSNSASTYTMRPARGREKSERGPIGLLLCVVGRVSRVLYGWQSKVECTGM